MKQIIKNNTDYLSWIILVSILCLTTFIAINMQSLKSDILKNSSTKIQVIDVDEFEELCEQIVEQWGGKNYIVYLYQPNSIKKTHKELASTSFDETSLPIRLEFTDSEQLRKNTVIYGKTRDLIFNDRINIEENTYYALVPILNYNIVNAEIYIFFKEEQSDDRLKLYMSESQVLNKMLN